MTGWSPNKVLLAAALALLAGCVCLRSAHGAQVAPPPDWSADVENAREGAGGTDVVVFVLDSAVSRDFLDGRVLGLRGKDITHGSLVARVVRSYCTAAIVSVPVENSAGRIGRAAYLSGLAGVLDYVRAHGDARVLVNISLGSPESDPEEHDLIRKLTYSGALVVAAAGNDEAELKIYPAAYAGVLAVAGATKKGLELGSNWGEHIALGASGDITFIDCEFLPYERLQREMEAWGTSFAAPRVTATLAYILEKQPGASPRDALEVVRRTARPIADERFEEGKIGAGALDIYAAKSAVYPLYRWVHYGLPIAVFGLIGVATAFVLVRYRLVGVFVSLLLWLVGVPLGLLLSIGLKRYLEFVGVGFVKSGPLPITITGASVLASLALLRRARLRRLSCYLAVLALLALLLKLTGLRPLLWSLAMGAGALAYAFGLELRTRAALRRIRALPEGRAPAEAIACMTAAYAKAADRRLRRAASEAVTELPADEAEQALLAERRFRGAATALLAEVKAHQQTGREAPSSGSSRV